MINNCLSEPYKRQQSERSVREHREGTIHDVLNNELGQQVYKTQINHDGGSATQTLALPANLQKGVYQLQVLGTDSKITQQLIKN